MSTPGSVCLRFSDGYSALGRFWDGVRPVRTAVLYLHGIQSHGGWFEASAARLARAGCAVLLPDRRGSGQNQEDRGHAPSARRLLQDGVEWLDFLRERTGQSTVHVLGVSWGGKLALGLRRHAPHRVTGLSLVAPGLFPRVDLPFVDKVRVGLTMLAAPRSRFNIPLNDPEQFTANPARQAFIRTDPLKLTRVTSGFLIASRRLDRYGLAVRKNPAGCPLRVFLAGRDRIIDNRATRNFVRRLHWTDRTIIEYPEAHHTLEFESDPEPYFTDLTRWLSRIPAPK